MRCASLPAMRQTEMGSGCLAVTRCIKPEIGKMDKRGFAQALKLQLEAVSLKMS